MAKELTVYRTRAGGFWPVGTLYVPDGSFTYHTSYLFDPNAQAISVSLPLRAEPYSASETRPYFEGLLPEGDARRSIAATTQVREDDYLALLASNGFDCLGDIVVAEHEGELTLAYEPVDLSELSSTLFDDRALSLSSRQSRLSLAGTQFKTGLAHLPHAGLADGWFRPTKGAASTHILKVGRQEAVLYLEYLCMRAASSCGVHAARTDLLDFGRPAICSERYDRLVEVKDGLPVVTRLHQEDLTQAFGLLAGSKYYELEGGTAYRIASLLRSTSSEPISDLDGFVLLTLYNYAIGNCDNHLKNISVAYSPDWSEIRLAPAYDLVCTTWFPDLSREMGMALGGERNIDEIVPANIATFGKEVGYPPAKLADASHKLAEILPRAIENAVNGAPDGLDEVAWKAEGLLVDAEPRLAVLAAV